MKKIYTCIRRDYDHVFCGRTNQPPYEHCKGCAYLVESNAIMYRLVMIGIWIVLPLVSIIGAIYLICKAIF